MCSRPQGFQAEVAAYRPDPGQAEFVLAETGRRWGEFCAVEGGGLPLEIAREVLSEEDWAHARKAHYRPLRVGRRFVVKPSWEAWPPADAPEAARVDDLVIELDPQMAFGTGTHETTQLCLEALERYLAPGERVADLGCGSGILAIGAALLGASAVCAWDVDPLAVVTARENCARSRVAHRCRIEEGDALQALASRFDVVVANVHTAFLLSLISRLPAHLTPGGRAILSGAAASSAPALREAVAGAGLHLREEILRGEWIALVAQRKWRASSV